MPMRSARNFLWKNNAKLLPSPKKRHFFGALAPESGAHRAGKHCAAGAAGWRERRILGAFESPVLNCFCYLGIGDAFHAGKIRNRARDLEYAVISARG